MEEKPTVAEPNVEPQVEGTQNAEPEIDGAALLKELKAIGVEKPEQIQGMHTASQQSGRLANMVGDLKQEIDQLKSRPQPRATEDFDYGNAETLDLRAIIQEETKKAVKGTVSELQKDSMEAYQRNMSDLANVQNDESYGALKDVFEEHLKSPHIQMQLQSGATNYSEEYNKVFRRYATKLLKQSAGLIEQLQATGKAQPPHMESGTPSVPAPAEADARKEELKKITEKSTGSDEDLDKLLDVFLPKDDPLMQV